MTEQIIQECKNLIQESDAILIGAGSGLSTAAGIVYGGDRFTNNFADFIRKYGITDMYSAGFYPFKTPEEKWAYWSKHIKLNRYDPNPNHVYKNLLQLVKNKPHFVITTNVDNQFFEVGFDPENIFDPQGNYGKLQCSKPCHTTLYDNKAMVLEMVDKQSDCKIPSELIPYCPKCGEIMKPHLRIDQTFVENENWHKANANYSKFVSKYSSKKMVLLELGIGYNTPGIIRFPFEQITANHNNIHLIRVNMDTIETTIPLKNKSTLIKGNIAEYMSRIIDEHK